MSDDAPDLVAQIDQAKRSMRDVASLCWSVYDSHRKVGFSKTQSFEIAREWFVWFISSARQEG